jgi:ASC-1-like (ASCH) protein
MYMNEHQLKLVAKPFNVISSGQKTIESRLFDEKRKAIQLDDIIVFTNRENPSQTLRAKVVGLLRYKSFADMFTHNDSTKFGGENADWLLRQISEFYSEDEQEQLGVIGIEFVLM